MPTLTLPRPHAAQQLIIDGARRFNVICLGRRAGKTTLGSDRLIHTALQGKPAAWFSPNYKMSAEVWRDLQNKLQPVIRDISQQERRLQVAGGGSIELWSLDSSDGGRGRAYATVIIDECALIPDLERAWQEGIRPMLTDHKGGAWFLSTPKGTANYFHTLYQRGQDPSQSEWASWQMPSSSNPYLPAGEIDSAKADMTDLAFSQEYLAHFVSFAGAVFRRILDAIAEPPSDHRAAIIGADWGRVNDYTVFTALSASGQVLAIDRFRGLEYSLQRGRLAAFWQRMGGQSWIIAEANNMGGPVIEQLQRDGLPVVAFTTTNASKSAIVQALALAFERGAVKIPNDPVLIGELQAFEAKALPSGMTRYSAPEGLHDDMVMSLAIGHSGLGALERAQQQTTTVWLDPLSGLLLDHPPEEERYQISPY